MFEGRGTCQFLELREKESVEFREAESRNNCK